MSQYMISGRPPHDRNDFEIAVICALSLEAECVMDVLDKILDDKKYGKARGDNNAYTLGLIGEHNVVLVHMPGMGTTRAAYAVGDLKKSFPNIELALVVGVCGGMPYGPRNEEVLLGDVVISEVLIQYDFGKQYPRGFERKKGVLDTLGPPSEKILALHAKLGLRQHMQDMHNRTATFLQAIQQKSSKTNYPGAENDILHYPAYTHQHRLPATCNECEGGDEICKTAIEMKCEDLGCEPVMRVNRNRLVNPPTNQPTIHFGIMGSGDTVMKSGHHRDALALIEGIIAVEMEGAGVWRYGSSVVIKGVCDYADSHKRKGWQRYAAATAAACAKAFLLEWYPERIQGICHGFSSTNTQFRIGHISDRTGPEMKQGELIEIADSLLKFDLVSLEVCKVSFRNILTGRLNNDDPNAKDHALSSLQDVATVEEELLLVGTGRRQFHEDFLTNSFLLEYTGKSLSLLRQSSVDESMVQAVSDTFRNMLRQFRHLPEAIRNATSLGLLGTYTQVAIRRRWMNLREMCEFMEEKSLLAPNEMVPPWLVKFFRVEFALIIK